MARPVLQPRRHGCSSPRCLPARSPCAPRRCQPLAGGGEGRPRPPAGSPLGAPTAHTVAVPPRPPPSVGTQIGVGRLRQHAAPKSPQRHGSSGRSFMPPLQLQHNHACTIRSSTCRWQPTRHSQIILLHWRGLAARAGPNDAPTTSSNWAVSSKASSCAGVAVGNWASSPAPDAARRQTSHVGLSHLGSLLITAEVLPLLEAGA